MDAHDAPAVGILAGGAASRAGGVDKGWVRRGDRHVIEHVLDALAAQDVPRERVVVSANRHVDDYRALGVRVVHDEATGFAGPFAGVVALLHAGAATTSTLITLPVDVDAVPPDFLQRFADAPHARLVVARDDDGEQPLVARYATSLAARAARAFADGERSVRAWQSRQPTAVVEFRGVRFGNRNTLAELSAP